MKITSTLRRPWIQLFRVLQTSEDAFLFLFAPLAGIASGFGAVFLRWLIEVVHRLFFEGGAHTFFFLGRFYVILLPALGGLFVGLLREFFHFHGHGIPEVMETLTKAGGKIRARMVALVSLASSLTLGSGGSAGPEGPIVQIGAALGSGLGQLFQLSEERVRLLIASGSAAGIAAIFNAPLAGTFFALEVILGEYGPRLISSLIISSVMATVVSRALLGSHPAFTAPPYQFQSFFEFPLYFVLGVLSAAIAILFIKTLYASEEYFERGPIPKFLKPAFGGLLVGLFGLAIPQLFGEGYLTIEQTLHGQLAVQIVLALVALKILATSLTLGSGGAGGVFAPALFLGAVLGEAFGRVSTSLFPHLATSAAACALIGMGAVLAATSDSPITAILLLFELTGTYKIILPIMLTCTVSTLLVRKVMQGSIYTLALKRKGIATLHQRGIDLMESVKVSDAMYRHVVVVHDEQTVREAGLMVKNFHHRGFPVVNKREELVGVIAQEDINRALAEGRAESLVREIMTKDVITVFPTESLRTALEKLGKHNIGRIPVVELKDPKKLIGLVTRKVIVAAYNRAKAEREQLTL